MSVVKVLFVVLHNLDHLWLCYGRFFLMKRRRFVQINGRRNLRAGRGRGAALKAVRCPAVWVCNGVEHGVLLRAFRLVGSVGRLVFLLRFFLLCLLVLLPEVSKAGGERALV